MTEHERTALLYERIFKHIPQATKDRVHKYMSCAHYCNGGDCNLLPPSDDPDEGTCDPDECTDWEERK